MSTQQLLIATKSSFLTSFEEVVSVVDVLDLRDVTKLVERCKSYYKRFAKIKLQLPIDDLVGNEMIDKLILICLEIPGIVIDSYQEPTLLDQVPEVVERCTNELVLYLLEKDEESLWNSKLI